MADCRRCKKEPASEGHLECTTCLAVKAVAIQQIRQRRRKAGKCVDCEKPRVQDHVRCLEHLVRYRQYHKVHRERRRQAGKCIRCTAPNPLRNVQAHCPRCVDDVATHKIVRGI